MKYVIHEVEDDIHEELGLYGIDFDDADLVTTYADEDEGIDSNGTIREVRDINLTVFDAGDHTVAVFPVDDFIYEESVDPSHMLETYKEMMGEYDGYKHIISKFQELTRKVIDPEVWIVEIPATLLEDVSHTFETKQGSQSVRVRSYIIKKTAAQPNVIRFDTHALHSLCNNVIDFAYMLKSLQPSDMTNILVTIFDKNDSVVAIRTTKLRSGLRAEIKGAYACSKGFGTLIQAWTENLIRTHDDALFPTSVAANKPVTFRLSALPTAVGFWKHVGFQSTGEFDKENQEILEKRIYPDNIPFHVPTGLKRRQSSPSPKSSSSNNSSSTIKNKNSSNPRPRKVKM